MVNLTGHEAGNGGYSQGTPKAHRAFLYSESQGKPKAHCVLLYSENGKIEFDALAFSLLVRTRHSCVIVQHGSSPSRISSVEQFKALLAETRRRETYSPDSI
jgi:hypothetical protein